MDEAILLIFSEVEWSGERRVQHTLVIKEMGQNNTFKHCLGDICWKKKPVCAHRSVVAIQRATRVLPVVRYCMWVQSGKTDNAK